MVIDALFYSFNGVNWYIQLKQIVGLHVVLIDQHVDLYYSQVLGNAVYYLGCLFCSKLL